MCRQLKDKYMYTEHYNNQQNIPELLKAILQQNANVFSGPPPIFLQGNQLIYLIIIYYYGTNISLITIQTIF